MIKIDMKNKQKAFEVYREARKAFWQGWYDKTNNADFLLFSKLEFEGGKCFKCGHDWIEKSQHYYVPGCKCYPACPQCNVSLYTEFMTGVLGERDLNCNCGFRLIKDEIQYFKE